MTTVASSVPESDFVRLDQNNRRSRAIIVKGMVYLSGQVADNKTLDITGQARQALEKIDDLLAQSGTNKSRVVTAQIWLSSMQDYEGFNAIWDAWVIPNETPTRSCAKVEMADPEFLVEIVVTASLL